MANNLFAGTPVYVVDPANEIGIPVRLVVAATGQPALPVYTVDRLNRIGLAIYETANLPSIPVYYVDENTGAPL